MRIFTNGARHFGSQLPRIEDGFRALGHEITPYVDAADLVYSNDSHAQVVRDRASGVIRRDAKVILTALDVPTHLLPHFDLNALRDQLAAADAICTISAFGQWQVKHYLGLDSTVVYQPRKPTFPTGVKKHPYRFMFCGRVNDSMKRCALGAAALQILGHTADEVITVGSEPPHYGGTYWGVASDETLNDLYNSAEFLMFPSAFEGLGLPPIEMVFAGGIPVVCNDCPTMMEWFGAIPDYREIYPTPPSIARFLVKMQNPEARKALQDRLQQLLDQSFRDKFEPTRVAQRILDCYHAL